MVERMKAVGAIPIGRTNMPDMGLRLHTDSALYGLTCNPWNLDRTVGGSSGGEAAAKDLCLDVAAAIERRLGTLTPID